MLNVYQLFTFIYKLPAPILLICKIQYIFMCLTYLTYTSFNSFIKS